MQNDDRVGEIIGGRWTLERILGAGVTAEVYLGLAADGRRAAVKLLFSHMAADSDVVRRFEQEARVVQSLDHPGIVKILDYDMQCQDGAYIAFEYLDGETLAARSERQSLSADELVDVAEQVASALAAAHSKNVVHRDLKPSNVFITNSGQVKILDFGVARVANATATMGTQFGMAIGTVAYMAPEQALGKHDSIDGRTDVFSLGAMLFRLLTGEPVHPASSVTEALQKTASEPARSLTAVCPGLPRELALVVDMSLAFAQEARYESASAMQRDLLALKAGAPSSVAGETHRRREQDTLIPRDSQPMPEGVNAPTVFAGHDPAAAQAHTVAAVSAEPGARAASEEGAERVGQILAGRYRIEALLGTGGMGAVYRAEHVHMRKKVAVKLLHRSMTAQQEVVARFEREAIAAARIEHPNVAAAKDFGKLEDGSCYLVLEYVEGKSLRQVLREQKTLPADRALGITEQVGRALAAAHASGIVHRDLKPENIMLLQRPDGSDWVKVLDFGIAKLSRAGAAAEPQLTQLGTVFGTPEYMSPEQAMGNHVDAKSDIYSLGIILYELVSGKTPFAGGDMMAVLTSHMTQTPAPLPASVPGTLASYVTLLLDKKPEARPTASVLVEQLAATPPTPQRTARGVQLRTLLSSLRQRSQQVWQRWAPPLERKLHAHGVRVPLQLLLPVALASVLVGVLLVVWLMPDGEELVEEASPKGLSAPKGLQRALPAVEPAEVPDETKAEVERINGLPVYKRRYEDWLTLARATSQLGRYKESVLAYQAVLSLKASMRDDDQLAKDLARAAYDEESFAMVVNLCATRLKQRGVDLLWLLWQDFRKDAARTEQAELLLKKLTVLSRRASRELRSAIEVETGTSCSKLEKAVERAAKYSDERALERLAALKKRDGCGAGGAHDCFPCLRRDDMLERAYERAKSRKAPSLL